MGALAIEGIGLQLLVGIVGSVIAAFVVAGFVLFSRGLASLLLRLNVALANRGLSRDAQQHLQEWIASWESEMREGRSGLAGELSALARIVSFPLHLRSVRQHAASAAKRNRAQKAQASDSTISRMVQFYLMRVESKGTVYLSNFEEAGFTAQEVLALLNALRQPTTPLMYEIRNVIEHSGEEPRRATAGE